MSNIPPNRRKGTRTSLRRITQRLKLKFSTQSREGAKKESKT